MTIEQRRLTDAERLAWLRLIRSENVGPITFFQLLRRFGAADAALQALPDLAKRGGRKGSIKIFSEQAARRELDDIARAKARLVAHGEADYPTALAHIDDAPPLICVRGHPHLGMRPCLAMVGARNASAAGIRQARDIAAALGQAGVVIVSGLARGIDTAAHQGALTGGTIAVLAGGIDVVYPPENAALYEQICEGGLVIAEMPVGTEPQARHFPRRNRLISGVARAVLVVEAALKSGSLITARFALEQGRDVMAIPGSPLDPRARGGNDLIRHGALLVESAEDVIQALAGFAPLAEPDGRDFYAPSPKLPDETTLERARSIVVEKLGPVPVDVDELIRQSGETPAVIAMILLELELAGRIERHAGGRISLVI